MNSRAIGVFAAIGLSPTTIAQTPSFIYHIQPANPNLNPGQTTTVTVRCEFSPGVGQLVNTPIGPRPVLGLSSGSFNILGSGGSWSGLAMIAPYNFGPPAIVVGSNVIGQIWGNGVGPPLGIVSTINPTPIWNATFTAPAAVGPVTLTLNPVGAHGLWAGNPGEFAVESLSTSTTGAQTVITVIPAPATASLLGLAAGSSSRRRRPSHPGAPSSLHRALPVSSCSPQRPGVLQ